MIKKKVTYSIYSRILTIVVFLVLLAITIIEFRNDPTPKGWMMAIMLGALIFFSLLYAPVSVMADEEYLVVKRPLCRKVIPMEDIVSVSYAPPTMGEVRCCASGGFMGYWGWYSNKVDGNYFGYYGRASETFLIELRNGMRYIIGCDESSEVAEYIRKHI